MTLMSSGDGTVSAFPIGDNLVEWRGTIQAPAGTVWPIRLLLVTAISIQVANWSSIAGVRGAHLQASA
jgi:hypothetical protein